MSGNGQLTYSAVRQLAETDPDHIVLEKDTYLIDENNRVIPIPAGTVAVLDRDSETTNSETELGSSRDFRMETDVVTSDLLTSNMPADSTSMVKTSAISPSAATISDNLVGTACEVMEATSSDPNPFSDIYVEEEEEVADEVKDQEPIVSASGTVEESTQSQLKGPGRKPGRKPSQKASRRASGDGEVCGAVKRQKGSAPTVPIKQTPEASGSSPTSVAGSTVSASGRPQRSVQRRSTYELLHGGELKPQRRSHPPGTETADQESSGCPTKKRKVSKSGAADEGDGKEVTEEAKEDGEAVAGPPKGQRRSVPSSPQMSNSSEGCDPSSSCPTSNGATCVSANEVKYLACTPEDGGNLPQSTDAVNSVDQMVPCSSEPQGKSAKLADDVKSSSVKKQSELSEKPMLSKRDSSQPAVFERGRPKKKALFGKGGLDLKFRKMKAAKKSRDGGGKAGDSLVPGMPYHFFTTADECPDSDGGTLADDLASEDVDWMRARIHQLEVQVCRLQEKSAPPENKRVSRCWQDVLAEFVDAPPDTVDEKELLARYEEKLRALDRELDERASLLRVREGCIVRRERRILEKQRELNKKERELEHRQHLHGRVKLPSESMDDSNWLLAATGAAGLTDRKQALEKEVRLDLRRQQLDQRERVLEDARKKVAAKEQELEHREAALVDADLLTMASGFTSSSGTESRGVEASQANGGTTVEFSDDDDDNDFGGGNSLSTFGATRVPLTYSLDRRDIDNQHDASEVTASAVLMTKMKTGTIIICSCFEQK